MAEMPPKEKKPLSGYLRFCQTYRGTLKTEEPSLTFKEVSSRGGAAWKDLSQEDKDSWKRPVEVA